MRSSAPLAVACTGIEKPDPSADCIIASSVSVLAALFLSGVDPVSLASDIPQVWVDGDYETTLQRELSSGG